MGDDRRHSPLLCWLLCTGEAETSGRIGRAAGALQEKRQSLGKMVLAMWKTGQDLSS